MDILKSDLLNEKVTIGGKEYVLTNAPTHDEETGYISFLAKCGEKEVIIEYKLLDCDDPECYDIESPELITDLDSGKEIYRKELEYELR